MKSICLLQQLRETNDYSLYVTQNTQILISLRMRNDVSIIRAFALHSCIL